MRPHSGLSTFRIALGSAVLLASAATALAGDMHNGAPGGIKDYGGNGVPVPVPAPYEETYKWYVNAGVGSGVKHSGTIATSSTLGTAPVVSQPNEWAPLSILSVGFGRYITPALRTEFSIDYRTQRTLASGTKALAPLTLSARVADGTFMTSSGVSVTMINIQRNVYSGAQTENIQYQNTSFMMSAFYDFNREGRWRPYIGAGIGLARHELQRHGLTTLTCTDGYLTSTPIGFNSATTTTGCTVVAGPPELKLAYQNTSAGTSTGWGLAAQGSAGVTFDITKRTHWDTGYRLLWQSGNVAVTSTDGVSTVRIKDRFDHELRTGIRWDLW